MANRLNTTATVYYHVTSLKNSNSTTQATISLSSGYGGRPQKCTLLPKNPSMDMWGNSSTCGRHWYVCLSASLYSKWIIQALLYWMRIWSDEDCMCRAKIRGKNVLELHLSERYLRKFEIVVHLNVTIHSQWTSHLVDGTFPWMYLATYL